MNKPANFINFITAIRDGVDTNEELRARFNLRSRREVWNILRRLKKQGKIHYNALTHAWAVVSPFVGTNPVNSATVTSTASPNVHYQILLDASGSMETYADLIEKQVKTSITENLRLGYEVSLRLFSTAYYNNKSLFTRQRNEVSWPYTPAGATPLNASIISTIKELVLDKPTILLVVTDGEETENSNWLSEAHSAIESGIATGKLTVAMLVPRSRAAQMARGYGVHPSNIKEWDSNDRASVASVAQTLSMGTRSAKAVYATGATQVNSGYFTPDLSGLTATKVAQDLQDLSNRFKVAVVAKETDIEQFVKDQWGFYIPGTAFYELNKRERKLSSQKQILLQNKRTGVVYGGDKAREIIGLPPTGSWKDVKVDPGIQGEWTVFVQSTSSNRKIPRGCKVALLK